jgi:hypothetical protein
VVISNASYKISNQQSAWAWCQYAPFIADGPYVRYIKTEHRSVIPAGAVYLNRPTSKQYAFVNARLPYDEVTRIGYCPSSCWLHMPKDNLMNTLTIHINNITIHLLQVFVQGIPVNKFVHIRMLLVT